MSEDLVVIKFTRPYSRPGGPGYNPGEKADFKRTEADYITKINVGSIVRTVPSAKAKKAPATPPKNKMVEQPTQKKGSRRLEVS